MPKYPFAFNILQVILTFSLMQSLTEAIQYYIPQLDYISTYIKQYESNFDQIVKYQINRAKIYEQYENGTLMIANVEGSKPYQIILFDSLNSKSLYNQFQLIDFSIDPWLVDEVHILTKTNTNTSDIITFNISFNLNSSNINDTRQQVDSCPVYQNSLLLNTNETFYIINPNQNNGSAVINRILRWYNLDENSTYFSLSNLDLTPNPIFTQIEGDEIRGTVCKKYFKIQQYLVLWNMSSYVQIYQCDYEECRLNGTIPNNFNNDSWVTDKINMGNQCNRIFIEYDDLAPAQTYNISGHSLSSYPVDQPIQQFKPIGGSSEEASILFPNNSYIIFSVVNNSFIAQYDDFGNVSQFTRFSWGWRELLMNYEDRIDIYKFQCFFGADMIYFQWYRGECTNCSNTCTKCYQRNGSCYKCIPDYEVDPMNNKRCRPIIYPNITANITANISFPSSPINFNTTPSFSNSTIIINVTTLEQNETSRYKYGAQYQYESIAAQLTIDSFFIIGKIIEIIFKIIEVFPLAWLLLNFINFWVICSFYVFLSVDIPQYLRIILKVIYDKINSPIIEMNLVADKIYPLPEKLSQLSSQFGISSSFLDMNFQSLLVFSFSTFIAGILALSIKYVPKKSWYYRNFADQIDFEDIIKSQFVSSTSNYFLPFALVLYKLNASSWNQKPNLTIHLLFMGMSFAFPFLVIGKNNQKGKINKNSKSNKKLENQTFKTIQWIYYSNCNTIVPFLCILEWPYIYLPFGFIFLSFGVWVAYHQDQFKINEIILASYRVIFHFFFTLVALFGKFSTPLKHHSSAICIGILFLGALHELLTVFFRSVFFLYQQIIKIRKKVRDKPHFDLDSIINTNPKEKPIHRFSYKFQLSEDPIKQQKQKQKTKKIKVHRGNKPPMTQFQVKSVLQSLYEEKFDCNLKKNGTNCIVQKQIKALTNIFQSLNQQPKSIGQQMTKRQAKKGNKIKVHKNKANLLHLFQNKIQSQIDIHKMQEKPE